VPLFVTSSQGLQSVYGSDGYQSVLQKLGALTGAGGPNAPVLRILDDAVSMRGTAVAKATDAASLQTALQPLLQGTDSVVIVGDQRVFPSFQVPNPVSDRSIDPDPWVLTDNPFGEIGSTPPAESVQPVVVVGRIAAGVSDSVQSLCSLLDWQIAWRQRKPQRSGYVEVTSRQWQDTSNFVLSALASSQRVFVSPDSMISAANAANLDCKYLYCNLHGFSSGGAWMGYDQGLRYPVPALTPDAFQSSYVSGTVCFTEACYGLATSGLSTGSSCALSLLAAGALGIVGSTGLAFGTATVQPQNLIDADAMAQGFFNTILTGQSLGACLQAARQLLLSSSSPNDVFVRKTLLEFQLLGDPSYVPS
jgi:Peptidase family C25